MLVFFNLKNFREVSFAELCDDLERVAECLTAVQRALHTVSIERTMNTGFIGERAFLSVLFQECFSTKQNHSCCGGICMQVLRNKTYIKSVVNLEQSFGRGETVLARNASPAPALGPLYPIRCRKRCRRAHRTARDVGYGGLGISPWRGRRA